jgi:hypothetical protein
MRPAPHITASRGRAPRYTRSLLRERPQRPDDPGWVTALGPARDRRIALLVADEPLRAGLAEVGRANGLDVITCITPLEAIQRLEGIREQIGFAIISTAPRWGVAFHELLAEDYPEIKRIVLVA